MDRVDFRRRAGEAFYRPVDGGAVVFHSASKRLFALNEAAALIWVGLQTGETDEAIVTSLRSNFSLPQGQADSWLRDCLALFDQVSAPVDEPAPRRSESMGSPAAAVPTDSGSAYKLLDRTVRIAAPAVAFEAIDSLLGNLKRPPDADAGDCDVRFEVIEADDGYTLVGPHGDVRGLSAKMLAGEIEQGVIQAVVPDTPHLLAFHAAMMSRDGQGVLLAAPSGSGKTTLSVVLARHGWRFCSDELALLGRDLLWRGVPFPACIKAESYDLVGHWWPQLEGLAEHDRFSRRVKFLKLPENGGATPVRTVIFPRFRAGAPVALEPMRSLDGLAGLLAECVYIPSDFKSEDVQHLLAWHDGVDYRRLSFGNSDEAAEVMSGLH